MELICDKKYLLLPASFSAQKKRLLFFTGDKLVFDLTVQLDYDDPDYLFPVNIERFKGKTLRTECDHDIEIKLETSDEPVLDYSGKYRPLVHFTSKRGWLNDPNGLTYQGGKYLMYYQHNPAATTWENMHWGSAESTDLIHWHEKDDVLFPDENGTVFSGSAIVDRNNVSGLKQGANDPILYFYTRAGGTSETSKGKPFAQYLAYSLDGGNTLIRYPDTLIEQITDGNRDPKVIYYAPESCYILVLFLEDHEFALFRSEDIFHWTELQRITLPDDAECPDFYPLAADGDKSSIRWIFSAASDRYYIGSFDGRQFRIESPQLRLNWGNGSYAAQSWSDTPDGRRIRTAFANTVIPGQPFGCCMDIPQEMSLKTVNGELRLCAEPVTEIKKLHLDTKRFENISLSDGEPFKYKVGSRACDAALRANSSEGFILSLFGLEIGYDPKEHRLKCGECEAPVLGEDGTVSIRVIFDTVFAEIYADSGSVYMGMTYIADSTLDKLTVTSENAENICISFSDMKRFY
ncbi:MAG: glycoside hydrolase family 32 protein [Ruminococcus sp.]|nr:glycoside hydrolase family 32 protein [Ruminococcus sp.]